MLRNLYYALPPKFRLLARRVYFLPSDLYNAILGKVHPMEPPKGLNFTGSGDFIKVGLHYMALLKQFELIKPNSQVLDIGCGFGRLAVSLAPELSQGHYHGVDIMENAIRWCNLKIAKHYSNCTFQLINATNTLYNTSKVAHDNDYKLPIADNSKDLILLTSVFTHLQSDVTAYYLKEIQRILKPGGFCFATFFTFQTVERLTQNKAFAFPYTFNNYALMNQKVPDANIAYQLSYLQDLLASNGLLLETIAEGWWSSTNPNPTALDFQDILILKKAI